METGSHAHTPSRLPTPTSHPARCPALPPQAASVFISANLATGGALEQIPGQVGVVFWGGLVLPTAYVLAHAFGQLLFKDALILKVGPVFGWVFSCAQCSGR